ncbi:MAG: tetratricopeptide repeat protein [Chitinophagales bacterium]|nr:tetratricopeptide repeat protein [Chitinophagales bacterium]
MRQALAIASKAASKSREIGYMKGEADALRAIGVIYTSNGKMPKALDAYEKALQLYQKADNLQGEAMVYNNMGIIYYRLSKFVDATEYYFHSLKLKEQLGDKVGSVSTLTNIGSVYQKQSNYSAAVNFYRRAIRVSRSIKNSNMEAVNYQNIAEVYIEQKKLSKAKRILKQALQYFENSGEHLSAVSAYINLGVVYKEEKNYEAAIETYHKALAISLKQRLSFETAVCWMNIGEAYLAQKNFAEAEKHLLKALISAKNQMSNETLHTIFDNLSEVSRRKNDYKNAYNYLRKYLNVFVANQKAKRSNQISEMHMQYEVEKREKEAEIFRLKNVELKGALQKLDAEKKQSEKLLRNILPADVAEDLKTKGSSPVKLFKDATVMFIDFKNFTLHAQLMKPEEIVEKLSFYFTGFEEIIAKYKIEKIKTIGDAFMCVCGVPKPVSNHALKMVQAAVEISVFVERNFAPNPADRFEIRVGIHSGPVIGGIIGTQKLAYDIWGDTVNTAARMEQNSEPGKINISEATKRLLKNKFDTAYRGKVSAKNKGEIDMFFVLP